MDTIAKTATTRTCCEHCKKRVTISVEDLVKTSDSMLGRTRFLKYVCNNCGEGNYIYLKELPTYILRRLNEM